MARRRPAGRPGRRRSARSPPPRARSSSGRCSSSGSGRPRWKSAGDGGDGSVRKTLEEARGVAVGGRESRCDRRRSDRRVPAPHSCRSSFPMRRHRPAPRPGTPCRAATRAVPRRRDSTTSSALTWLVVGSAAALLLLAPAAVFVRRRRARRDTSGGCSRCGGAGRLRPQAVARRPGVRARPAACRPARLRAHGGVARRDRALARAGRDPDRVHGPRPSECSARALQQRPTSPASSRSPGSATTRWTRTTAGARSRRCGGSRSEVAPP